MLRGGGRGLEILEVSIIAGTCVFFQGPVFIKSWITFQLTNAGACAGVGLCVWGGGGEKWGEELVIFCKSLVLSFNKVNACYHLMQVPVLVGGGDEGKGCTVCGGG